MSGPGGTLWVDPDGVASVAAAYDKQVTVYKGYQERLAALRQTYSASWGNDEQGVKFSAKFLDGTDTVDSIVDGTRTRVSFAATALRGASQNYSDAEDNAQDVTGQMATYFETPAAPTGRTEKSEIAAPVDAAGTPSEGVSLKVARLAPLGHAEAPQEASAGAALYATPSKGLTPQDPPADVSSPSPFAPTGASLAFAQTPTIETVASPGLPSFEAPTDGTAAHAAATPGTASFEAPTNGAAATTAASYITPTQGFLPTYDEGAAVSATPLLEANPGKSWDQSFGHTPMSAVGPLAPGQRIEALAVEPDGSATVDAARYLTVSALDGPGSFDEHGRRLFAVEDNPAVDPTAPDYRPLHVSYPPGDIRPARNADA